ncbi:GTP pyrophosphokinase [Abditibacterium utsteinense]|uniref:GTP pyrophosphokinase n=1 Tax=Abditibacterium utsteinense TaxID=1960156 RepID=A0A2S8SSW7_9BACT|nr:bifunctional (p)ppGpp synthetase/guanosine-3',5'-bis(diphosphate) 3'-pyrophosphohydrolase [Abditibacterium utsteinense]PQV63887.1 GTP pyrophosphokinase [Abditibacterium utsteinense]
MPSPASSSLPISNETHAPDAISALSATDFVAREVAATKNEANSSVTSDSVVLFQHDEPSEAAQTARRRVKELVEKTLSARPQFDAQLLERAYAFAAEKHEGVTRLTGEPYIEHPVAVAGILAELGMDDVSIAAGFLHDVPEDCGVSIEEMTERFGADVAHLVEGVTKLKKINFDTKVEKQGENLRKLFLAMAGDVRVIIIKLADRLHNMRTIDPFPEAKRRDVASETLTFFAPIAHRLGIWRIKWELEDRSFKVLEPDVYKQIYALVQRTRAQRAQQVQEATAELQERLKAEGIEAEVNGRPKHFYSIRQKMIKQGLKFDAIHDLIALRVICNSKGDCYHALGIVHALWQQVPEMFFDYIATPKPNNYQSLHTKVLDGNGELLEIQIRTKEMHREAEFGIAAHWRYKNEAKPDQKPSANEKSFGDRLRWLRPVVEMGLETEGDSASFLSNLRLDVGSEQVFVITPHGDAIYLPQGSTPVDFAYRVHSQIGGKCTGAKVNGRLVPLNYKLHNGDICEIQTSRASKGPKRGWLEFVVTPHAKARIKAFLRKQNFDENYRYGLERLEKVARSERLKIAGLAGSEALENLALELGQKGAADLIAAIGYGEFSAETILNRVRAQCAPQPKTSENVDGLSSAAASLLNRRIRETEKDAPGESGEMEFAAPGEISLDPEKTGDLLYTLARCCAPIPGDEVRGYVTRGRGITVHRTDCANLKHYEKREPDRLLRASWKGETEKPYQALVALESHERTGLLADVTAIIAAKKINIESVNTYPLKHARARLNLAVSVASSRQLDELIAVLSAVEGVIEVHRV